MFMEILFLDSYWSIFNLTVWECSPTLPLTTAHPEFCQSKQINFPLFFTQLSSEDHRSVRDSCVCWRANTSAGLIGGASVWECPVAGKAWWRLSSWMYAGQEGQSYMAWIRSRSVPNTRKWDEQDITVVCLAAFLLWRAPHCSIECWVLLESRFSLIVEAVKG